MSLSSGLIAAVALAYVAVMFAIAFYGDRRSKPLPPRVRAWVYSLSLAVYCQLGIIRRRWSGRRTALGIPADLPGAGAAAGMRSLGATKMVMISKQENITSIADFIAARYGKSIAKALSWR